MKVLKILFSIIGFALAVFSFWFVSQGFVVTDWQEYARACFGILAYLGIVNLIAQLWK